MNTFNLKENILKQVDSLNESELQEFLGLVINFLNSKTDISDWDKLSSAEKKGILDAIWEVENGHYLSHKEIITKFNSKFSNA